MVGERRNIRGFSCRFAGWSQGGPDFEARWRAGVLYGLRQNSDIELKSKCHSFEVAETGSWLGRVKAIANGFAPAGVMICRPVRVDRGNGMPDTGFPHAADLRRGRFSEPESSLPDHHCYSRSQADLSAFRRRASSAGRRNAPERTGFAGRTLAGVIMPDHPHRSLVLRSGSLATLLKRIKARSAQAITWEFGLTATCLS